MKLPTYEECIKKAMESVEISVNNETGISILECVEKQTPKKPNNNIGLNECQCPVCKTVFGYAEPIDDEDFNDKLPYCWNCGQKIDWSVD